MIYEDYGTHRQSSFSFYKISPSSTPKSGNLRWINNGCKLVRAMGGPRLLGFSCLPDKPRFYLIG